MGKRKFGIIGGGIMGMQLAHKLANEGNEVTLFEAAPELGGLTASWKIGDFMWDKFYHVILLSDFRTRHMLKEIGLEDQIQWVETKTGFYTGGKLYSMSDTVEFLKFPPLNLIDKFRLGLTIIAASKIKDRKRMEQIPVTTWLKRWSGVNTFNKLWLPLLRAKLGEGYLKSSAAFIWATIQRLYGARKSGLKKEMFGYVPGGYYRIINAFKDKLLSEGVTIKTNRIANQVKEGINGKPQVTFLTGETEEFDNIIITLPSTIASRICVGLSAEETIRLNQIEYLGVVCVAVLLDKPISPFYVTNITDSWVPFTGVIEMSALVDKKHFGGNSLVYLPKYVSSGDPMFDLTDEEIKTQFTDMLLRMYPEIKAENIKFAGVAKARNVITLLTLNYSEKLPNAKTSIPGVYIINSAYITDGTLNVNETLTVAETKFDELLRIQE
ncbi:MAG TPA: NAD(P)/FAD-dependent oxidoreductase [Bacteroidales bacterium]